MLILNTLALRMQMEKTLAEGQPDTLGHAKDANKANDAYNANNGH